MQNPEKWTVARVMNECLIVMMNAIPDTTSRADAFWKAQNETVKLRRKVLAVYGVQFETKLKTSEPVLPEVIAMNVLHKINEGVSVSAIEEMAPNELLRVAGATVRHDG